MDLMLLSCYFCICSLSQAYIGQIKLKFHQSQRYSQKSILNLSYCCISDRLDLWSLHTIRSRLHLGIIHQNKLNITFITSIDHRKLGLVNVEVSNQKVKSAGLQVHDYLISGLVKGTNKLLSHFFLWNQKLSRSALILPPSYFTSQLIEVLKFKL